MDIKVYPGRLSGTVQAPPSKSMAHRALICGALAEGTSVIRGISGSKDMEATIGCMAALGADIWRISGGKDVVIRGIGAAAGGAAAERTEQNADAGATAANMAVAQVTEPHPLLDCIESGSTLRFLLPVAAALGAACDFTGRGKLPERPMTPLADEMKKKGVVFLPEGRDCLPFSIQGKLQPGVFTIPGNISSQYISGLIFALPLLDGDSEIHIEGTLESAAYVALTLQTVRAFGISVEETAQGYRIPGKQHYCAGEFEVEGDYSNAAFWMVAAACGSDLTITGLRPDSTQGDRRGMVILAESGAAVEEKDGAVVIKTGSRKGIDVDSRDIPDLIPVLSVAAANATGTTRFLDAGRLRIKESDRLAAMADCLMRLGCTVEEKPEELIVTGSDLKGGCEVSGYNDHRIVMSMAIAALLCKEPVIIRGAEAITKSYPDFFEEYRRLGGRAEVIAES